MPKLIPTHLIHGPLGVGKTTAVVDFLRRQQERRFTAVMVNDFGPMGMDDAIIEGSVDDSGPGKPQIRMVPGGCICCTASAGLMEAFDELMKLSRLDRIIIEPSGIAMIGDMLDLLHSLANRYPLQIRPIITMLDPKRAGSAAFRVMPYFIRMVESADILVANRCDLATAEQVENFTTWANSLYPPKLRVIATHHGQLPDEVFELESSRAFIPVTGFGMLLKLEGEARPAPALLAAERAAGHTQNSHPRGLLWDAGVLFNGGKVESLLRDWAANGFAGVEIARLKGILHTDVGWYLMEIAMGEYHERLTDYRRDNRVDWITHDQPIEEAALRQAIESAIIATDASKKGADHADAT